MQLFEVQLQVDLFGTKVMKLLHNFIFKHTHTHTKSHRKSGKLTDSNTKSRAKSNNRSVLVSPIRKCMVKTFFLQHYEHMTYQRQTTFGCRDLWQRRKFFFNYLVNQPGDEGCEGSNKERWPRCWCESSVQRKYRLHGHEEQRMSVVEDEETTASKVCIWLETTTKCSDVWKWFK